MAFLITTTGTPATVIINDLGERTFVHPVVSFDLKNEYSIDEISNSIDLQTSIAAAEITAVDGSGNSITDLNQLVDLQSTYNNSNNTEILTDNIHGSVTITNGDNTSGLDDELVYEGKNFAGTSTFSVNGRGDIVTSGTVDGIDIATDVAANTLKVGFVNLTGDVTSIGAATAISAGSVEIAMLSASGTPGATTFLRGDNVV